MQVHDVIDIHNNKASESPMLRRTNHYASCHTKVESFAQDDVIFKRISDKLDNGFPCKGNKSCTMSTKVS